ncbi:Cys-rich peptide radical SAM maturase CcpM [Halodesulfovibrio sp.]|jgi:uncharacterized protein|uniref:Cys-rich peptide radical SAM maturase CcpM n=1 Tax=Halodesulfovibrio sp. TaxID=1912772 RepID=UPI0025CE4F82|nr:Cys-rich peptide radical SAM maturase CcpM [Halodesulfovibrio sp.]MCT4625461.1 Cys-rich peptide radical SAM maturase CcpM [Halodesulfovibrio sp.]
MMHKNNELFFSFCTPQNHYVYDANKNSILKVTQKVARYLEDRDSVIISESDKKFLDSIKKLGWLQDSKIEEIVHPSTAILPSLLERRVEGITLQITQQCNLRCKYCVYSGCYDSRGHTNKAMSFETACKGVDFLLNHSIDCDDINIGFYGGEPLLAFNVLKKVVAYVEEKGEGKNIGFHITTNGTLFTEEILTYLQEKKFHVLISLDGDKEQHDKNRVFAVSGTGTFDTIMKYLGIIKEHYSDLYSRMTYNAVIDPTITNQCSNNFFLQCKEAEGVNVTASIISSQYRKDDIDIPDEFFIQEEKENFKLFLHKLNRLESKHISKITLGKFEEIKGKMFLLRQRPTALPEKCHPGGPCVPGVRKLFLNVDGELFPCERVSESSKLSIIGNLIDGFDFERIESILNVGRLTASHCKKCWAFLMCTQCIATADQNEKLSAQKRLAGCKEVKGYAEEMLKDYCTLLEYGFVFENDEIPLYTWD